jgi:hypothetical protein
MRARQRHFPYKASGALLSYDARYIAGSNGSEISTWENGSSTSYSLTQSTSTNRPLLQTGTNGINNQNAVKFDGIDDNLSAVAPIVTYITLVAVGKFTSANPMVFRHGPSAGFSFSGTSNSAWLISRASIHSASGVSQWMGSDSAVASFVYDGNGTYYKNGVAQSNETISGTSQINQRYVSSFIVSWDPVASKFSDGLLGILLLYLGNKNDSLRKRTEHASSYSYKLACS